jgi:hypothetical protein
MTSAVLEWGLLVVCSEGGMHLENVQAVGRVRG